MGIFSGLFKKKKKEDFSSDEKMLHFGDESIPPEPLGLEEKPVIPEMPAEPQTPGELPPHLAETRPTPAASPSRDLELISSKLDTLKAILNSMDQRIANLEEVAGVEKKKMPW